MHYHFIEDAQGDIVDAVAFCSDACHRDWCASNNATYGGWNGCQEGGDSPEYCAECGELAWGEEPQADDEAAGLTPCRFSFMDGDGPTYEGFSHGTTWNGWDNVSVTPGVRDQIIADFNAANDDDAGPLAEELAAQAPGEDGLIDLSNGWTTSLED